MADPMLPPDVTARLAAELHGSGPEVTTVAPFTGEPLVTLRTSTSADVAGAYKRARAAQPGWAATSPKDRARIFVRFHDLILANEGLIDIVQGENGKSRNSAFEETIDVAGLALYYGRTAPSYLEPRRRKGAIPVATKTWELRHPKGVAGVISPFNYPLSLGVCDVIPALLAGNAIVHKPDTQAALTALRARELLIEAGLPPDVWQVVVGEPDAVGQPLIDGADHICFTGSTAAGRRIAEAAARRLISVTLELGGKNPMVVLEDADLEKAATGAVRACFSTTGQLCLSIERLYVHESVYEAFLDAFVRRTAGLTLGSGLDFGYDIGTLSSQRQLDRTVQHVDQAVEAGAKVEAGGRARPDLGPYFYEPTVLTGVTPDMDAYAEETFGPVVSVYTFADEDDAVAQANDTEFGLNASIWTKDAARGRRLGARVRAGTVSINEGYGSAYASNDAPMGGMKASGLGRRHGEHGLLEYCELQTVASQHVIGFEAPRGLSTEQNAKLLTRMYKVMKGLRIR
jgi:acyl-CoA reductase-like NAD-dependent aldehyde dehydrogenase